MRCIYKHKGIYRNISRFHYSIIMVFFFLVYSTHCYASSSSGTQATQAKEESIAVQINGFVQPPGFSPAFLTLHINDTVVFINHALPARSYTLSADDGSFSSPSIPAGGQWAITFHALGSHTYRDTSNTSTMVGELMIVAKNIYLLATPNPLVEATVITYIKNKQNPPDTIIIPTQKHATTSSSSNSLISMFILIVGITISTILLGFLGFLGITRYRRRARSVDDDLDDELTLFDDDAASGKHSQQIRTIIDNARKKLQTYPPFKAGKLDDDDDDDDDY